MAGGDRLSAIVFSGDHDRVHYALGLASAAAAAGRPVTLMFTMGALAALKADGAGGARAPAAREQHYAEIGIATIEELIAACVELGVDFMVCDMGLRAMGMTAAELRPDIAIRAGGMVTFLNQASSDGCTAMFI